MQAFMIVLAVLSSDGQTGHTEYPAPSGISHSECMVYARIGADKLKARLAKKGLKVQITHTCKGV